LGGALGLASLLIATSGWSATEEPADTPRVDPAPVVAPKEAAPPYLAPRYRITYSNLIALRVNPIGLEDRVTIGFEERVWSGSSPLLRDTYVGLKLAPTFSPAVVRLGPQFELKPLAVLALRMGLFYKSWFGTFSQLAAFDTPTAAHSDSDMKALAKAGKTGAAHGAEFEAGALLQAKVGPIAVRSDFALFRAEANTPGKTVHYDVRLDMVVPNGGFSGTNDTDLIYVGDRLILGARASTIHAFYRDQDYLPGESHDNLNTPAVRVGPALGWRFFDHPGSALDKPTVLLLTQWWLLHRYRTGQDVSQAMPYIALAFRIEGEIASWKPGN
jgi:hypothetical protein